MSDSVAILATDPAQTAGRVFGMVLFLVVGALLLFFGIRRLNRRSRLLRAQRAGQFAGPRTGAAEVAGGPPGGSAPSPPGLAWSVVMIVVGALMLLGVLSNLASAAGGA